MNLFTDVLDLIALCMMASLGATTVIRLVKGQFNNRTDEVINGLLIIGSFWSVVRIVGLHH